MDNDFEKLLELTSVIKSRRTREMVRRKLETAPKYFREVPASSSGKYHPLYTLGHGGLVRHTMAAVKIGMHICNLKFARVGPRQQDQILAALFLHDTRKQGDGDEPVREDFDNHAKAASDNVKDGTAEFDRIGRYILVHMGQWGNNQPANLHEFIVHLADYLASRRDIVVDLGGDAK